MQKIREDQLKKVVKQQNELSTILGQIGTLESQKHSLLHKIADVNQKVEEYKDKRRRARVMSSVIRKISIGSDYKNDAMHYSIGQEVYGGHKIAYILFDEKDNSYNIHIKKNNEVLPWKKFNSNMAISIEYDLQY